MRRWGGSRVCGLPVQGVCIGCVGRVYGMCLLFVLLTILIASHRNGFSTSLSLLFLTERHKVRQPHGADKCIKCDFQGCWQP